jgi:hypothetical protein
MNQGGNSACRNCNTAFTDNYSFCPACGQRSSTGRLTVKLIIEEVIHAFFHADKSIFRLIKELAIRPGVVALEYINGKRKKYFNPFTFLVLVVGLSTFAFNAFGVLEATGSRQSVINAYLYKHYNLIVFVNVPLLAFFSWILFKKSGKNYAENLVLSALLSGERALAFSIFIAPLFRLVKGHSYILLVIYLVLWCLYYAWGSTQFFGSRKTAHYIKGFLVPVITQIITTAVITAIVIMYYMNAKNQGI